jgi:hypothetical protein
MKLKNMVNKDIAEIMKKLLHGLDYKTSYIVEFSHDMSVEVSEAEIIIDKKSNTPLYYTKRGI